MWVSRGVGGSKNSTNDDSDWGCRVRCRVFVRGPTFCGEAHENRRRSHPRRPLPGATGPQRRRWSRCSRSAEGMRPVRTRPMWRGFSRPWGKLIQSCRNKSPTLGGIGIGQSDNTEAKRASKTRKRGKRGRARGEADIEAVARLAFSCARAFSRVYTWSWYP